MNYESIKIRAETTYIRFRTLARTLLSVVGIGLVLLGAYNMLLVPAGDMAAVAPYRVIGTVTFETGNGVSGYYLGDVVCMAVGAILAWFT